ncbi:MAG: hypothetical protein R2779_06810 [Crocinitomicaceae bacterium]
MRKMMVVFCALCFGFNSLAQVSEHTNCDGDVSPYQKQYNISYGDSIITGVSSKEKLSCTWSVSPESGVTKTNGTGVETGAIVFTKPGDYKINYSIPAHDGHASKVEVIDVKVSDVSMKVDVSKITFSKKLTSGSVDGIVMKVPVDVKVYGKNGFVYTTNSFSTTGVSRIAYSLKEGKANLKNGVNYLEYELTGSIAQPGTIQFRISMPSGESIFFNKTVE